MVRMVWDGDESEMRRSRRIRCLDRPKTWLVWKWRGDTGRIVDSLSRKEKKKGTEATNCSSEGLFVDPHITAPSSVSRLDEIAPYSTVSFLRVSWSNVTQ